MNWDAISTVAEVVGAVGVIVSLIYLALQVKGNTAVVSAQSRHSLSEFALQLSMFRAQHADRWAKINEGGAPSPGDQEFLFWSHMQVLLHAETYFHHQQLGLMPETHWRGYERFIIDYIDTPGFVECWASVEDGYSEEFSRWLSGLVRQKAR